jgi:hypothetical protein
MKPVRIVILATMALLPTACAATSSGHPAGSGAPSVSPSGNAGPGRAATRPQSTPAGGGNGANAPSTLLLGHLIMRAPASWRVTYSDAKGDFAVSTGSCNDDTLLGSMSGSRCPSFSMIVGASAATGPVPTDQTYRREKPYAPSSGVLGCPGKPGAGWQRLTPSNSYREDFAPVSTGTAYYTVWKIGCGLASSGGSMTASFYFEQQDWYLPGSQILIVDEYPIAGLAAALANATWR